MPYYNVTTYEIHEQVIVVEADSPAGAVALARQGDGDTVGQPTYIRTIDYDNPEKEVDAPMGEEERQQAIEQIVDQIEDWDVGTLEEWARDRMREMLEQATDDDLRHDLGQLEHD